MTTLENTMTKYDMDEGTIAAEKFRVRRIHFNYNTKDTLSHIILTGDMHKLYM